MNKVCNLFLLLVVGLIIESCGNSEIPSVSVSQEYSERLIGELRGSDYSIVLNDMNVSKQGEMMLFQHKYHILKVEKDSLTVDSLDWKPVNRGFFEMHENDLGMEIVSNHNNKLSRVAKPVGFDWAIGNEKEGQWEEEKSVDSTNTRSSHRRVWRSHGSSGLFWYWMLRRPAYQRNYAGHRAYQSSGRAYYGANATTGTSTYGTNSTYQKAKRPSFFSRKSSNSSWKSYSTARKSASSSRYNGASSIRSRSGGIGK